MFMLDPFLAVTQGIPQIMIAFSNLLNSALSQLKLSVLLSRDPPKASSENVFKVTVF